MKFSDAVTLLSKSGVDNPAYDAGALFMHFGGYSRIELSAKNPDCDSDELLNAIKERARRKPLQYIIGEVGFYRESYKVSEGCLIPRTDTEILVDYAVKNLPAGSHFLDLCTGSGCIAVSTVKNAQNTTALAVDLSEKAIAAAKENARLNGVFERISFLQKDVLEDAISEDFFAILSNPPYVTEKEYKSLEPEIYFEPKMAFVSGDSGVEFYERIVELYKDKINKSGFFAFEIGFSQADALRDIACRHGFCCEIIKDYSQNDRVAILKLK